MTKSQRSPQMSLSSGVARPLNLQAQDPMGSTGSSYIKSEWCHLSSWFMCPYVRPCKSSKESSSCVRCDSSCWKRSCWVHGSKEMQDCKTNARHAKPGGCETARFLPWLLSRRSRHQEVLCSTGISPSHHFTFVFPACSLSEKSEQRTVYILYIYIYQ